MTERVLNLVTYIQWEKPQVIEYDKICNGLKTLSEILSIYSYIIIIVGPQWVILDIHVYTVYTCYNTDWIANMEIGLGYKVVVVYKGKLLFPKIEFCKLNVTTSLIVFCSLFQPKDTNQIYYYPSTSTQSCIQIKDKAIFSL